jgi:hypothetical protein
MHETIQHVILLICSVGASAIGWFMAHNPARVYRTLDLAGTRFGQNFFEGFVKVVGWCFTALFAASALMQLIFTFQALLR